MNALLSKKLAAFVLCGILCVAVALPAYGAALDGINVNGSEKVLNAPIIKTDASVLISLKALGEAIGMQVGWNEADKRIHCLYNKQDYKFSIGRRNVEVEQDTKTLSAPVQIINGSSYIPLNGVVDVFEGKVELTGDRYSIIVQIDSGKQYGNYTFDELVDIAYLNSIALATAKSNYQHAKIMYSDKVDNYQEYPSNNGDTADDLVSMANLLHLEGAEISLKTAEIAVLTAQDQIRYQLKDLLNDISVAEGAIQLANEDLKVQQTIQAQNELKFQNGMISRFESEKGAETLKTKSVAVTVKTSERDALLIKLDNYLKLGIQQYGFLKNSEIGYEPFTDMDIDGHVKDVLSSSPSIFGLEQLVKLKEANLSYYVFNGSLDPYEAIEIDLTTAKQNLNAAKDATDVSLRQMFEQLTQLSGSYQTLTAEREKLVKDYEVAKLSRQAGLITDLSLQQVKLGLETVDQQILNLKGSYESLKNAYIQPWAAQ